MNLVVLMGRLVAEPDVRTTQNGNAVATYRLAVDKRFKRDGQPTADFIQCVTYKNGAEFAEKYLHKGTKIAVMGIISTRNYDDKNGNKVYVTEVIVDQHYFCESKQGGNESPNLSIVPPNEAPSFVPPSVGFQEIDEDLPF